MSNTSQPFDDKDFKPIGATVFFILLLLLGLVIWFSIYNIQIERVKDLVN